MNVILKITFVTFFGFAALKEANTQSHAQSISDGPNWRTNWHDWGQRLIFVRAVAFRANRAGDEQQVEAARQTAEQLYRHSFQWPGSGELVITCRAAAKSSELAIAEMLSRSSRERQDGMDNLIRSQFAVEKCSHLLSK